MFFKRKLVEATAQIGTPVVTNLLQNQGLENRYMSLSQEIRGMLLEAFIEGELEPGTRINDLELANRLGVSRTPVREALRGLQSLGIIETLPARITRVAQLNSEAFGEARTVWARLYRALLTDVVSRVERSHIAQMLKFHNESSKATGDKLGTLTFRLFNTLLDLSDNDFLTESIRAAAYRMRLAHRDVVDCPQFAFGVREAQAKFVSAIADSRVDRACEAITLIATVPLPHEIDNTPNATVTTPHISQWGNTQDDTMEPTALAG